VGAYGHLPTNLRGRSFMSLCLAATLKEQLNKR
jgi:hypothetical protein